jgi:hypothetical protein
MVGLPRAFINSCKTETIVSAPAANSLITTVAYITKQELQTFC